MDILGIIPARGGSKRLPGKNIRLLAGKPLIAYTIEAALRSNHINRVILSTEDPKIAEVGASYGAEIMMRPQELAQDTTKTAPVLINVVEEVEKQGYFPQIVVLLQPTSPLRDEKIIDDALLRLINSDNDSIFTGTQKGKTMPFWKRDYNGKMVALYDYHFRPRYQEPELMEDMFAENGAFYAIKIDAFKKYKDFIGETPEILVMPYMVDIDTAKDFETVEKHLQNI